MRAYLAGLVDGEGHLGILRRQANKTSFRATISIFNTHVALLKLQEELGFGRIYAAKKRSAHHKTGYIWKWETGLVRKLLPQIMPYLRIRLAQAKLMSQYLAHVKMGMGKSPEYFAQVEEYYSQMKELNRKGVC